MDRGGGRDARGKKGGKVMRRRTVFITREASELIAERQRPLESYTKGAILLAQGERLGELDPTYGHTTLQ